LNRTRPELQPKELVRIGLLTSGIIAGAFLFMAVGKAFILVTFAMLVCLIFYILTVGGYRPKPSRWAGLPAMALGIITIFPANIGSHSLWLTVYGETLRCKVTSIDTHVHRRSPNTYSNGLQCGDRQVTYHPSMYRDVYKVGAKMDIVVDKTGFVPNLEPDKVGLGHSLMLLLAGLMTGVFVFLVAWLPVREPVPTTDAKE
jgi:hypothetical protein